MPESKFSAALLAGGRSRRMGRDKRLIPVTWDGEVMSLWEKQLRLLRHLGPAELLVSGPADLAYPGDILVVPDRIEDAGPLGGILSCLETMRSELLLVLAVDLPAIEAHYLQSVVQAAAPGLGVVPMIGNELEPVAAIYPVQAAPIARRLLQQGERSVRIFARELEQRGLVRASPVAPGDEPLFRNWNSPADLGP